MKSNKSKVKKISNISKKIKRIMPIFFVLLVLLLIRIGYLQFVKGNTLKEMMYNQLTTSRTVSPKRGTIYDSTGKALAISAQVDTVSINPTSINVKTGGKTNEGATKALKEKITKAFSDIFELDYETTLEKVSSNNSYALIARKVEKEKIDELKQWMKIEDIHSGINIDEDTKRYYPYENLASTLMGFCGNNNEGRFGLELEWDNILTGIPGKVITSQDAVQQFIPDEKLTYIPAKNGSNLTLTIDANIQSIVEKYLKQACIENKCGRGGNVIVMNPKTGDILAMATYPDYNLNKPFEIPSNIDKNKWNKMSSKEKTNSLYTLYRNRAISDNYEPGSIFKIITTAIALEEDLATPDKSDAYFCNGVQEIAGKKILCSRKEGHGKQSLRDALANSCNPAFIQIGEKIGSNTFYKYCDGFGFFKSTGINTSSESNTSIFWDLKNVGPVEIATMSFGQRFEITPLQMITAACSLANNGILMKPRIVKEIKNTDTGAITTIQPIQVRQVISKKTSKTMMNLLETVVTDGTGKYAKIKGYSIAGKTGTSEPDPNNKDEGFTSSFLAISPVENPEVVILITLYKPQGSKGIYGGKVAGPVVCQIFKEILPYLQITSDNSTDNSSNNSNKFYTLPDVTKRTIAEAKKILQNAGFTNSTSASPSEVVTEQYPIKGSQLIKNSIIKLYTEKENTRISKQVPNLIGKNLSQVKKLLKEKNLNINITGSGTVVSQEPIEGIFVEEGSIIKVTLK